MLHKTSKMKLNKKQKELIATYVKKGTNVSATCAALGISRMTFYRWMKDNEEIAQAIDDAKEQLIDNVETKLISLINDGHAQAIMFFLKTRGKKRGYVERTEITGGDGERLFKVEVLDGIAEDTNEQGI
jgi:transposase-like protein